MKLSPHNDDRLWREPEKTRWFRFSSPLRYIIFLILLILLLVGLWYLIAPSRQWYNKADLALIQADQTPYKIKAEDQGVPSVKHQDKLVYGRIRADQTGPVAEHILPAPEEPLPQIKEEGPIKMVEQYTPEDADLDKTAGETAQKKPEEASPGLISIEDLIENTAAENSEAEKIEKGKVRIQLGSLKNYDMAEAQWKRLSQKLPTVLAGLEPVIQKIDMGEEKGIYYRLQTGPFENSQKAAEACTHLKAQKAECVVID